MIFHLHLPYQNLFSAPKKTNCCRSHLSVAFHAERTIRRYTTAPVPTGCSTFPAWYRDHKRNRGFPFSEANPLCPKRIPPYSLSDTKRSSRTFRRFPRYTAIQSRPTHQDCRTAYLNLQEAYPLVSIFSA